ncbi:NAD-dependent epimerase/dehydratase family protein [Staphylococcus chromogenes]|uniref:polysaccharide biosynthesis C-terminal domain-containing protein n=1 Tax=Staphylococcus chromogenes TaxID=46126 RepID=UPI0028889B8E|nr:NAD-dependent epimerase/dehydratase family protein [Staphylococcus chromogenes]MDT0716201.1 NAD-dependent epimerase/dehydratase family protein [Staphylococcus chromogenes]
MKIAITGANGFVGQNLYYDLKATTEYKLFTITRETTAEARAAALQSADVIVHLAGVNRPREEHEFKEGNVSLLETMLTEIKENPKQPRIILSSSIQAEQNNPYGNSKREGEEVLRAFGRENGNEVYIYRFPNLFGKWCKPNYNSVIATFCHNIAHDKEIQVNDPEVTLNLNYIDDVIAELKRAIEGHPTLVDHQPTVPNVFQVTLGHVAELIYSFKETRNNRQLPRLDDPFEKALYSTYLSYLPEDQFKYDLTMHRDERGSFTEFVKTPDRGQMSVNISKPGIVKGNHWHHTKNEKFLVVSGQGVIRFRKPGEDQVIEYYVSGDKLEVVDIPVGYTHNIENLGQTDMVTLMWVNEMFDPDHPDTYFLEV